MTYALILLTFLLQGAAGIIGQLIILRELPIIFYGNELSFGIILTSWLFWAALGSGLVGRLSHRVRHIAAHYLTITVLATVVLLVSIVLIRNLRVLLQLIPGEIVSFPLMVGTSLLIVAPYALLQGYLFTVAPRIFADIHTIIKNTNTVYVWEALGALGGCLYYYFIGITMLDSCQNIFLTNGVRLLVLALAVRYAWPLVRKKTSIVIALAAIIYIAFVPLTGINTYLYQRAYKPLVVIDSSESIYGNIVVTQQSETNLSFFENGLNLFSTEDVFTNEETTQFALLAHPHPQHILLLSGGSNGCLRHILDHPSIKSVTYIELDALLVAKALEHLPPAQRALLEHPQVSIVYDDARHFIKTTPKTFDIIISLLPEPFTLQINRLYTQEFFTEVRRILNPNGIFSFSLTSSESFINDNQARLLRSLQATLQTTFTTVHIIPGNRNIFLASTMSHSLPTSSDYYITQLKERQLTRDYINEFYLPTRLMPEKTEYVKQRMREVHHARLNFDFNPISYYYDMILWSEIAYPPLKRCITFILNIPPAYFYVLISSIFLVLFITAKKQARLRRGLVGTVAVVGLSEISLEIILILLFQVFMGYIYSFVGIIIGSYMAGLALGAWWGKRRAEQASRDILMTRIITLEGLMVGTPLAILLVAHALQKLTLPSSVIITTFIVSTLATGCIGGMQFPYVNTLFLQRSPRPETTIGLIYSIDLLGSSLGAFVISLIIIPILGIQSTLIFLAYLNILCLVFLLTTRLKKSSLT